MTEAGAEASGAFERACQDMRKAFYETHLLARLNPQRAMATRQVLAEGDARRVGEHMQLLMGVVATPSVDDAFGGKAAGHTRLATIMACLLAQASGRGLSAAERVAAMKRDLKRWIDTGGFDSKAKTGADEPSSRGSAHAQARRVAELMASETGVPGRGELDDEVVAQVRLGLVAPLAGPLEAMRIICGLDEAWIHARGVAESAEAPAASALPQRD